MRYLVLSLVAATSLMTVSTHELQAQAEIGAQALYNVELADGAIGIGGRVSVPVAAFDLAGDANWYFPDCPNEADCTLWEVGANLTFDFGVAGPIAPYLGAGLTYQSSDVESTGESDTPVSIVGGIELGGLLPLSTHVEAAYRFPNDIGDQLIFSVGFLF